MPNNKKSKLSLAGLALMVFTTVYGFNNIPRAFYMMGYGAIPWYIASGLLFFLPFAFMVTELGSAFKDEKGGIFSWMEKAVGPTFSFIGTFMWYASYLVWMVTVSNGVMVPVTNAIFGNSEHVPAPWIMSLIAIGWMAVITFLALRGMDAIKKFTSVGGIAVLSLNAILLVCATVILIARGHPATAITAHSLVTSASPNFNNGSFVGFIAFMVFAVFAFGGVEAIGGLVDETDNPKKNFPRGVITSAVVITVGYALMILCVGFFLNYQTGGAFYQDVLTNKVNLGTAGYMTVQYLGDSLGLALGLSSGAATLLGGIFARYMGLAMILTLLGAFFTLIYSPVKQIINGTPDELWPGRYGHIDEKTGMPKFAMIVQLLIVTAIILLNMLINLGGGPQAAAKFFEILTYMANVAMTLPYLFIIYAYAKFKLNDQIEKPFTFFKSKAFAMLAVVVTLLLIGFANFFTIIQPLTDFLALPAKAQGAAFGDMLTQIISMIAGPILFALTAIILMRRYKRRNPKDYIAISEITDEEKAKK